MHIYTQTDVCIYICVSVFGMKNAHNIGQANWAMAVNKCDFHVKLCKQFRDLFGGSALHTSERTFNPTLTRGLCCCCC